MAEPLSTSDRRTLLKLAREALEAAVNSRPMPKIDPASLSPALTRPGAGFVTLTNAGALRGCIGSLMARQPLYADVREHALQAALEDYRFPSVTAQEAPDIEIEISVLTAPEPLKYDQPVDLPGRLRPEVDGVILMQGFRRATFLPQVWEHIPDPELFLCSLCEKMGVPADTWRRSKMEVQIYQVEKFTEAELREA